MTAFRRPPRLSGGLASLLVLLLAALPAFGQTPPIDPTTFDRAADYSIRELLGQIFGTAASSNTGDLGVLTDVFTYFNLAVITAGSILFVWASITGTLATAHDGSVLGKRWSSMWVPVRFALSAAVLLPTAKGLSIIQVFVFMVVGMGVGIANTVWDKFINAYAAETASFVDVQFRDDRLNAVAKSILEAHTCLASMRETAADLPPEDPLRQAYFGVTYEAANNVNVGGILSAAAWQFGDKNGQLAKDLCGSIVWTAPEVPAPTLSGTILGVSAGMSDYMGRVIRAEADLAEAHRVATDALVAELSPLGFQLASRDTPPNLSQIAADIERAKANYRAYYVSAMRTAIYWGANQSQSQAIASNDLGSGAVGAARVDAAINGTGWANAGGWFYNIAATNSRLARVVGSQTSATPMKSTLLPDTLRQRLESITTFANSRIAAATAPQTSSGAALSPQVDFLNLKTESSIAKLVAYFFFKNSEAVPPWQNTLTRERSPHPLIFVKEVGEWILAGTEATWLSMVAAQIAGAAAGSVTLGNGASSLLGGSSFLSALVTIITSNVVVPIVVGLVTLFVFGATLAFYLPVVPYVFWLFGVVGWMIVVFEAVLAAPLWAVMHMHPEGEGIAGAHAKQGYNLILELFMRPTLMIFGLIGALLIAKPLFFLLNSGFWSYTDSMKGNVNPITSFLSFMFSVIVYSGLAVALMHKAFSLIHYVPRHVMNWITGGREQDGAEHAHQVFAGGFRNISQSVQQGVSSGSAAVNARRSREAVGGVPGAAGGAGGALGAAARRARGSGRSVTTASGSPPDRGG